MHLFMNPHTSIFPLATPFKFIIFLTSFNGKLGHMLPNLPQIAYVASLSYEKH